MTPPPETKQELKPCPHCGRQPEKYSINDAYRCKVCSVNSGWLSAKDWNTRSDSAEVKRLMECCNHTSDQSCLKGDECVQCLRDELKRLREALEKIKDCDYPLGQTAISVAKEALEK